MTGVPAVPARRRRTRLSRVLSLLLVLVVAGVVAPATASAEVGVPVTYVGHSYGAAVNPSADKPQSKLWYLGGSWWALMVGVGTTSVYIHELMPDHTWRNTGTLVDDRAGSTGDALWSAKDGRLYVASRVSGANLEVNAFTFNTTARTWSVLAGFPVTVNSGGGSESVTIDQDSTGQLWVTYTRAARLWVAHSTTSPATWTSGFQPPGVDTVIKSDDLSALIAFDGKMGVLWSDQESGAMRFAIHQDGAPDNQWTVEDALVGAGLADDHINLKQLVGDSSGRIFAAIKTSADEVTTDPSATLVGVLVRTPNADGTGSWSLEPAGTLGDNHTRPIIMIDSTNKELYFFATQSGDIVYKKSPLSNVSFPTGRGAPFVDTAASVNNASGAKDPVTAASRMVILAGAEGKKLYVHAEMELAGGTTEPRPEPGDTTPPTVMTTNPGSGASGVDVAANVTATFSEAVQGVDGATFLLRSGTTTVAAVVSLDTTKTVATLNPGSNLAAGTHYTAELLGGTDKIRDLANNPLTSTNWTFTTATASTGDGTAPTVKARTPAADATGVGVSANVTATFSEAVQGVNSQTFTLTDERTGALVPASVFLSSTTNKWVLDPSAKLAADTWHTVTLTGGSSAIRDLSGTPLATVTWRFLTGPPPTVKTKSPAANATGVGRDANVMATFSEAVQNVSTSTFVLKNASTGATVTAEVRQDGTTNRWILDPGVTLAAGTKYTVTVVGKATGVKDLAGNPMKSSVVWSFTTGSA